MQQFKNKDWLRVIAGHERPINSVFQIKSCLTRYKLSNVELWKPKEGEWCWFYNSTSLKREQRLARYKFANNGWYYDEYDTDWNHCEPFIGELPSFLKKNNNATN